MIAAAKWTFRDPKRRLATASESLMSDSFFYSHRDLQFSTTEHTHLPRAQVPGESTESFCILTERKLCVLGELSGEENKKFSPKHGARI